MLTIILPLIGIIFAPLLSYLVAVKKNSGKIATTEAGTLWLEAEKIRMAYKEEAERLRGEVRELSIKVLECQDEITALKQETIALRKEAVKWREEAVVLRAEAATLRANAVRGRKINDALG